MAPGQRAGSQGSAPSAECLPLPKPELGGRANHLLRDTRVLPNSWEKAEQCGFEITMTIKVPQDTNLDVIWVTFPLDVRLKRNKDRYLPENSSWWRFQKWQGCFISGKGGG